MVHTSSVFKIGTICHVQEVWKLATPYRLKTWWGISIRFTSTIPLDIACNTVIFIQTWELILQSMRSINRKVDWIKLLCTEIFVNLKLTKYMQSKCIHMPHNVFYRTDIKIILTGCLKYFFLQFQGSKLISLTINTHIWYIYMYKIVWLAKIYLKSLILMPNWTHPTL